MPDTRPLLLTFFNDCPCVLPFECDFDFDWHSVLKCSLVSQSAVLLIKSLKMSFGLFVGILKVLEWWCWKFYKDKKKKCSISVEQTLLAHLANATVTLYFLDFHINYSWFLACFISGKIDTKREAPLMMLLIWSWMV